MPGKDPAKGARDTGRTGRGLNDSRNRDTSGATGGGLGRSRGGLVGESDTAKNNRSRTGFNDPTRKDKPGNEFGHWTQRVLGLMVPGLGGTILGAGMMLGDAMDDQVQKDQEDVDAGRKKSQRMDDPGMQGMGRVDKIKGQGIGSFGNSAADDRAPNANGLGGGMTGGNGGDGQAFANAQAEERRRRRQAAQQTALGSINESLGPGVLPI